MRLGLGGGGRKAGGIGEKHTKDWINMRGTRAHMHPRRWCLDARVVLYRMYDGVLTLHSIQPPDIFFFTP